MDFQWPDKNPLHPSALRAKDLHPGMQIVCFNMNYGIIHEYTVLKRPLVGYIDSRDGITPRSAIATRTLVVVVRNERFDDCRAVSADGLGVHPLAEVGWNNVNFTVDRHKRHLLPSIDPETVEYRRRQKAEDIRLEDLRRKLYGTAVAVPRL